MKRQKQLLIHAWHADVQCWHGQAVLLHLQTTTANLWGTYAVGQFLLTPLLLWRGFVPALLSSALYAVALSYYHYLSFLGYSALPFLEHTEVRTCTGCHILMQPGMYCILYASHRPSSFSS